VERLFGMEDRGIGYPWVDIATLIVVAVALAVLASRRSTPAPASTVA